MCDTTHRTSAQHHQTSQRACRGCGGQWSHLASLHLEGIRSSRRPHPLRQERGLSPTNVPWSLVDTPPEHGHSTGMQRSIQRQPPTSPHRPEFHVEHSVPTAGRAVPVLGSASTQFDGPLPLPVAARHRPRDRLTARVPQYPSTPVPQYPRKTVLWCTDAGRALQAPPRARRVDIATYSNGIKRTHPPAARTQGAHAMSSSSGSGFLEASVVFHVEPHRGNLTMSRAGASYYSTCFVSL